MDPLRFSLTLHIGFLIEQKDCTAPHGTIMGCPHMCPSSSVSAVNASECSAVMDLDVTSEWHWRTYEQALKNGRLLSEAGLEAGVHEAT